MPAGGHKVPGGDSRRGGSQGRLWSDGQDLAKYPDLILLSREPILVFVEERPMIRYLRKRDLLAGSSAVP